MYNEAAFENEYISISDYLVNFNNFITFTTCYDTSQPRLKKMAEQLAESEPKTSVKHNTSESSTKQQQRPQQVFDVTPPGTAEKFQFILNAILQTLALIIGLLFGIFSVLAYKLGETANEQSLVANTYADAANKEAHTANQLALLSFCLGTPVRTTYKSPHLFSFV